MQAELFITHNVRGRQSLRIATSATAAAAAVFVIGHTAGATTTGNVVLVSESGVSIGTFVRLVHDLVVASVTPKLHNQN